MTARGRVKRAARLDAPAEIFVFRLYVAGTSERSARAIRNAKRLCDEHLAGRYELEVVDLIENPALARGDQILCF